MSGTHPISTLLQRDADYTVQSFECVEHYLQSYILHVAVLRNRKNVRPAVTYEPKFLSIVSGYMLH